MKHVSALTPSVLLLVAAAYGYGYIQNLPSPQFQLLRWLPLIVAGIGLGLSLHFNRSRVFFSLVIVAVAYAGLGWDVLPGTDGALVVAAMLAPANLIAFSLIPEKGIVTPRGLALAGIIAVQAGAVAALAAGLLPIDAQLLGWLESAFLQERLVQGLAVPQSAAAMFGIALVGAGSRFVWRPQAQTGAVIGALVGLAFAFQYHSQPAALVAFATAAALVLAIGVIQESYSMAYIDELTSLPGRRAMQEALLKLGSRYAIAMLDVDHFKKFNDTYGHDVGDQVLRMVASRMKGVGAGGKPFRYGGEEFSIVFPGKSADEVMEALEAVRARIETSGFALRSRERRSDASSRGKGGNGRRVAVTISIGVAARESGKDKSTPAEVMKAADQALYRAKGNGRNQVSR